MYRLTRKWVAAAAVVTAVTAMTAGCSSGGGSSSSGSASASSSSSTDSALAKVKSTVAGYEATTTKYDVKTTPVKGVSKLAGRTIYYIPLIQQIPTFVVAAEGMKEAAKAAGLKVQVCDGGANPSQVSSCVDQAVSAKAAGIVTDAIPYAMAKNSLDAAKAAGVPLLIADQIPPSGATNSDAISYMPGAGDGPKQLAYWMIADSNGKANAILQGEKDSPSSWAYIQAMQPVFKANCSGCTDTLVSITASTPDLLASDVSSTLLKHPDADYYYTEFEDSLQPTIQGIGQASRSGDINLSVASGTVTGLGMIKNNTAVKAVLVVDEVFQGWAMVDSILRQETKTAAENYAIPTRLFDKSNIGSITVSTAAQASGEWFGDLSFKDAFKKLWQ